LKAKILIVGGGAMGTCIALHAARKCDPLGEPVILIEKDRLGAGSSGRSGAIIHQHYSDRGMAGMARDALKVYAQFEQTTGRSLGYRATGVLVLAGPGDADRSAGLERDVEMQTSIGIDVRRLDTADIRALVPGIEIEEGTIGAFEPGGGYLNAIRAIESFATLARDQGTVTRIGVKDPTILVEDGRAVGVRTSAGNFYAPQIVLATGPWTPKILESIGVELPLQVVRTFQHFVDIPAPGDEEDDDFEFGDQADPAIADAETRFLTIDPLDRLPVPHPVIFDLDQDMVVRCEPAAVRTLVVGMGTRGQEEVTGPEAGDAEVAESFAQWAREALVARLPVYRDLEDKGSHSAFITVTPDGRPIIGPVEQVPGLFVVAGFTGNDFHLAPSIGEGLAQMLFGQPVSAFDPEAFAVGRFG